MDVGAGSPGDILPDSIKHAPAPAALLYIELYYSGWATKQALHEATGLPVRTVERHLDTLRDHGCLESRPSLADTRRKEYRLVVGAE